jgi:hypothetical protein
LLLLLVPRWGMFAGEVQLGRIRSHSHALQPCRGRPGDRVGAISGTRDETGAWSVEPVELHRVFPPAEAMPKPTPQDAQTDALVAELRAQLAEMRAQRDAWQRVAERLALGAPKSSQPDTMAMPGPATRPKSQGVPGETSNMGNVKLRGAIAQALCDVLAKKVPGIHSVHIATLGEDGRHIGGGSIGYANDEIAKGGLAEILEWAYANSSQSTNSQRAGSK